MPALVIADLRAAEHPPALYLVRLKDDVLGDRMWADIALSRRLPLSA